MKNRPTWIARTDDRRRRSFALHPLSVAICLGFAGAALAAPQGGTVVAGQATITQPTATSQVITQTTNKAIIDWRSFSIANGEKVRFNQPSNTSVTLNRVTGFDPSSILGEMSSNGKIFLVNPYGVVFGAGARVDVGGLVASTLSIANSDFLAGRYSLTSVDPDAPAQRGAVRNEGTISAPGGMVALVGPSVSNTGTIVANGGRVGMVAANAVSVDVEGDGLLFFQTSATAATNRLEQLGRIQADGGSIEMRAAARGAFADTVLNMAGVVQAKAIGSRGGQIVIDGGGEGIVRVAGRVDATGLAAGERGGAVTVEGQRVLLDNGSVVEASGSAGGGAVRVGGDFHGTNPQVRNSEVTGIMAGAEVRADATDAGNGGTIAIWSDGTTRFYGTVSAEGGRNGGDGGFIEVSGKKNLDFQGNASTLAPKGKNGTLLLDPTDIVIAAAPVATEDGELDPNVPAGQSAGQILAADAPAVATISTAKLETIAATNSIDLNASNSITIGALSSNVAVPNTLTLNTGGGSAQFHAGAGGFSMQAGNTISVTNGSLLIDSGAGPISVGTLQASAGVSLIGGTVTLNAPISVTAAGAGVSITGATTLAGTGGSITLTGSSAANDVTLGSVNGAGRSLGITAGGGDISIGTIGGVAPLLGVTLSGSSASLGAVTTTGAQNYSGVAGTTLGGTLTVNTAGAGVTAGATTLAAGGGTITLTGSNAANDVALGAISGAQPLVITAGGGDVTLGAATGLSSVTITASTAGLQAVTTSGAQNYTGVTTTTLNGTLTVSAAGAGVSAGATTLAGSGGTIALTGSSAANDVSLGTVDGPSTLDITANGGDVTLGVVGAGTPVAGVSVTANTASLQDVRSSGNQTYDAAVSASGVTLDAGTGSIAADNAGNDFTGALTLLSSGSGVSVRDANNLQLAAPTLGANTGLTAIAGGTLTLPNAAISTGTGSIDLESNGGTLSTADTLTTSTGSITLVGSAGLAVGDDLSTTSGAVSLTGGGAGGLTVSNGRVIDAGSGTIVADGGGGSLDFNTSTLQTSNSGATAITVRNGTVTLGNITAAGGVVLGVGQDVLGTLQQRNGTSIAAGTLSVSAAGAIVLDENNAIANLGNVTRGGAFTLNDVGGGLTLTGSVTGGTTSNAVTIATTGGALALGGNSITATTGAGAVDLTGVGVSQTAGSTITAGGTTTVDAGSGAINLQSPSNDFLGNVDLSATGSAAVRDIDALLLNSFSGNGITAIAGTTLSLPGGAITTTGGAINLQALGGTLSTSGNLTSNGGAITLVGATGLTVGNSLSSGGGAISLTGGAAGGLVVTTTQSVAAGAGTISLDGGGAAIQLNSSTLSTSDNSAAAVTIRNGAAVTLGNINAAAGTVQIGVGGDVGGAVVQTAGTTLSASTLAASTGGSISLGTAGTLTIANLGAVDRGGALTITDSAGGLTLTGDISGGTTGNAVSISTATGALDLGANDISATGAGGNLTLTGVGVSQTGGSLVAGGTTTVNGGTGSIDLQSAGNDFAAAVGSVVLTATGPLAAIRDANGLGLAAPTLGAATSFTAIAGSTLNLPAGAIATTGSIDLRSLGSTLTTPGVLTATNIALTGSAGLTIASSLNATGVSLTTTNAPITESPGAIITATGATTFNAGAGAVTLDQANILNSIGGSGGTVSVTEASAGGVVLAGTNAAHLTVATTQAGATVTQSAPLAVTGATTISTTGGGAVTLADPGNNFGSFGATAAAGAVSVSDSGAIVLDTITAASLGVDTSSGNGPVTQAAALNISGATTINAGSGAITLGAANALGSFGATGGAVGLTEGSAGGIALDDVSATSLAINTSAANGNVTQTATRTLTVSGPTTVNAGLGAVTLANAGNNLGSFGATGSTVSVRDSNALALGAINAGALTVDTSAGNGALSQTAPVVVAGATVVTTGSGPITLDNPSNDFSNLPGNSFSGGAISLRDVNDLSVTTLANGANQAVSVVAGLGLSLPGGVSTGSADLTLASGAVLTTPGVLSGNNVSLAGTGGLGIGNNVNAAGNLTLTTVNSAVNQTAGTIVSGGTTTVSAGIGAVTLAQPLNDFNGIAVVSGGVVSINDANALTAAANASGNLTITTAGALTSGGTLAGANIALSGSAGIALGHNVTTLGTLQLTTANSAIDQTGGAITAGGLTTAFAGNGDITLNRAGNDFSDAAGVSASGGAVRLQDANDLRIASLTNGANKDLSLTAGLGITGLSGNIDTGSADLTIAAGAGFTTFGTLRGTNVTLGGGTGGVSIGDNVTALGNLTLNATNASVTQTAGTIAAAGTTAASAGTGSISLALAGNDFGTLAASGSSVSVRDANGLALGPIATTTLTVDSSAGNGAITQTGASVVGGTTTIAAGTGSVSLTQAGNDFASIGIAGGAVAVTDGNALALNTISASSLTINTSVGNGNVTQNAAATVSGATAVNAGGGAVSLDNAGNNFGSVGASGGAVVVTDINALVLDALSASSLLVTAGGAVSQNGAAVVSGATTVIAGANAITLSNAGNDFASVSATGGAVSISDGNALALDSITATSLTLDTAAGNGSITQNAAAIVSGATTANAGSGAVALSNAGNNFGSVAAVGGAVAVTDVNALTLGAISASSLTVDTAAGNGAVTQSGAVVVSGAGSVNAGTGPVTLAHAGNDFAALGLTGGAIAIVDQNALVLSGLVSAPNQAVSVVAGGTLSLPATAIDTGSAALTLTSGGPLATVGTLRGTTVALTSAGAMTLAGNVTALGTLDLAAGNAPILQTAGAIVAAGTATVSAGSGDITLAQPSNDFQGSLLLSGGAVSVRDVDNLAVTSLVSAANRPVSLIAGGSLSLPPSAIDTGTADLTLQALGGTLVINGPLSGNNVTLTGTAGLTLGADITSSGDQIYTTTVQLGGSVTLDAGGSRIDLQGGANGNGNSLALTSGNAAADAIRTGAAVGNMAQFTVTGNSTLGGNVTTTGNQSYSGAVTLATDVALASGAAKIDLQNSVDAAGRTLALTSSNAAADAIHAAGVIANATQLTVTGKSTFASGVTTTGAQLYADTVTLGNTANFTGSSLVFGNGIFAGPFDLNLRSDALTLAGTVSGSGNASLSPLTQAATIGVAGGAGAYQVSQATLDAFAGFASLGVGRADGSGDLSFGNLVLPTDVLVVSSSGDVDFTGTVASAAGQARDLGVTTGGNTTFGGAVGGAIGSSAALGNLSVAGATQLNAATTANGTVSLGGPVTVGADATLSAGAVALGSTLDIGSRALTLLSDSLAVAGPASGSGAGSVRIAAKDAAGSIGIAGAVGTLQVSQALIDTFAGVPTVTLGRSDSTGTISVGSLTLPTDLAIANGSGAVTFTGSVDSAAGPARDLSVGTTGLTSLAGAVGTIRALDTLTISGSSQLGASIVTSGAQTYAGAASLVADTTLTGPSVSFGGTVDGARALAVNAAIDELRRRGRRDDGADQPDDERGRNHPARRQRLHQRQPDLQRCPPARRQRGPDRQHARPRRQRRRRPHAGGQRQHRRHARRADRRRHGARRAERRRTAAAQRRQRRHHGRAELCRRDHARRRHDPERTLDRLRQHPRRRLRPDDAKRRPDLVRGRRRRDDGAGQP